MGLMVDSEQHVRKLIHEISEAQYAYAKLRECYYTASGNTGNTDKPTSDCSLDFPPSVSLFLKIDEQEIEVARPKTQAEAAELFAKSANQLIVRLDVLWAALRETAATASARVSTIALGLNQETSQPTTVITEENRQPLKTTPV